MRYTKGKRGPETTHDVSIVAIVATNQPGNPDNPLVKGIMSVTLKTGIRMVSFLAQGKNAKALINEHQAKGSRMRLTMRWTARENVTITGVETPEVSKAV